MKKIKIILFALFLILPLFIIAPDDGDSLNLVRLHVIASSDGDYDQYVKLRVRDAVLEKAASLPIMENPAEVIETNLSLIEDAAKVTLASYGMDYSAKAVFGEFDFPEKSYGNITLPAGKYTAVRIILGKGAGKNWWCVMYPPLCFTDETTANFRSDTLDLITKSGSPRFKIKFRLLEIFE